MNQITTTAPASDDSQSAPLPSDSIGATVIYNDEGIYGYVERQERVGVIVGEKFCRVTGQHFLIKTARFNLPRLMHESKIVSYMHPTLAAALSEQTTTAAEAAAVA